MLTLSVTGCAVADAPEQRLSLEGESFRPEIEVGCVSDILVHPMTCDECIARGGMPYQDQVGVCEIQNDYTCGYDFVITCTP